MWPSVYAIITTTVLLTLKHITFTAVGHLESRSSLGFRERVLLGDVARNRPNDSRTQYLTMTTS